VLECLFVQADTESFRFRYAACQLEYLAECGSAKDVEAELKHLPPTLNGTYERILRKIDAKNRGYAIRAMAIIMASQEQIGSVYAPTLVTAVVGGPGTNTFYNIDMLRRHCICLVRVHPDKTVNLAHYTVREFLQSPYVARSQTLREFSLPERKVNQIYFNTMMSVAAEFSGPPNINNMPEDPNGDPIDFRLYALRRVRMGMFWNRGELASPPENKKLLMKLLDPYQPCYNGLQLLGSDGHSDGSNPAMFEWLPKFNPRADAVERDAAYLTMLIGFNQPDLIKEFLRGKTDRDQAALFSTKMNVTFPVEWSSFRKHGAYDRKATPVTVMEFYNEGHDRGFETDDEINILRSTLSTYTGKGPAPSTKKGPSSASTTSRKASLGSQSSSSASPSKSNSGRSTPPVGKLQNILFGSSSSNNNTSSTSNSASRPSVNTNASTSASSAPKSPRKASNATSASTGANSSRDSTTTATTGGGGTRLSPPTAKTTRSNSTSSNSGPPTSTGSSSRTAAAQTTAQAQQTQGRGGGAPKPTPTSKTNTTPSGAGGNGGRSGANTGTGKGNGTGGAGKDGVTR
jgi:hypothetical protein